MHKLRCSHIFGMWIKLFKAIIIRIFQIFGFQYKRVLCYGTLPRQREAC